mmetsp:Transcript_28719/g.80961  ORF Transcript_28719/g.80961 Transcript_28719/m.80961 type:complete len:86 (-) Transcript_28719:38-295(-)
MRSDKASSPSPRMAISIMRLMMTTTTTTNLLVVFMLILLSSSSSKNGSSRSITASAFSPNQFATLPRRRIAPPPSSLPLSRDESS